MNIFNKYNAVEMREIFRSPTSHWPEDFCVAVNDILASQLLDMWLESHEDDEYREEIRQIVEDITYGYGDENGNELLEFDENVDNDGQMRFFK